MLPVCCPSWANKEFLSREVTAFECSFVLVLSARDVWLMMYNDAIVASDLVDCASCILFTFSVIFLSFEERVDNVGGYEYHFDLVLVFLTLLRFFRKRLGPKATRQKLREIS